MVEDNASIEDAKSSARPSQSPLQFRPLGRASTLADITNPLRNRRSSTFSDSLDDARQSIFSSTDNLILPRPKGSDVGDQEETSHWHSAPLVLALLPAVGGLLFQNGGAVVTDVTLLSLAAIVLNWSVRLPWQWYYSSLSTKSSYPLRPKDSYCGDIIEEGSDDEKESHTPSGAGDGDSLNFRPNPGGNGHKSKEPSQDDAAAELRTHELLALAACFLFPLIGAWLLHAIRSQLSRPSEGLVSNYNLSIFLLASEIRPLSHLIKMIQARTLHLQRTLNSLSTEDPQPPINASNIVSLTSRLDELEAHVSATSAAQKNTLLPPPATAATSAKLTTDVRKALQPDLDALNRAVRRYEKRATLLALQTEARLQDLESRMSDAITLAAAAERSISSQTARRTSSTLTLLDWLCSAVVLPVQATWALFSLPAKLAATALDRVVERYLGTKKKKKTTTEPKSQTRPVGKPTGPQERERKALPPLISRAQNSKAMKKIF